jgi:ferredoxin
MLIVTLQRNKCIGCNYCVELAPEFFRMSKKDGKTILLKSLDKKGFHTLKEANNAAITVCENAAEACPVNIIKVKLI